MARIIIAGGFGLRNTGIRVIWFIIKSKRDYNEYKIKHKHAHTHIQTNNYCSAVMGRPVKQISLSYYTRITISETGILTIKIGLNIHTHTHTEKHAKTTVIL